MISVVTLVYPGNCCRETNQKSGDLSEYVQRFMSGLPFLLCVVDFWHLEDGKNLFVVNELNER